MLRVLREAIVITFDKLAAISSNSAQCWLLSHVFGDLIMLLSATEALTLASNTEADISSSNQETMPALIKDKS